jgi:hypothetical protein
MPADRCRVSGVDSIDAAVESEAAARYRRRRGSQTSDKPARSGQERPIVRRAIDRTGRAPPAGIA